MVVLACPIPSCGFQTDDGEVQGAAAILNVHSYVHSTPPVAAAPTSRAPRLERLKLRLNATTEEWNVRIGSNISNAAASGQLLECASEQLGNIILRA